MPKALRCIGGIPGLSNKAAEQDEEAIHAQAAEWIVMLSADDAEERMRAQADFSAWKAASPRHAAAAKQMENVLQQLQMVRQQNGDSARPARVALDAALQPKRRIGRSMHQVASVLLLLCCTAYFFAKVWLPAYPLADLSTGKGEWRTSSLPDGSRITLNSDSAINVHYTPTQRRVELVHGEILADVAKDANRPFVVETRNGTVRARGTRFVVKLEEDASWLSMLESSVEVRTRQQIKSESGTGTAFSAGDRVRFDAERLGPVTHIDVRSVSEAWARHQLVATNQTLGDVIRELARHRPGHIYYDAKALDGIRISAVLPLDDTDNALQLLCNNFPELRVRTLTRYLVLIDLQTASR